MKIKVKEIFSTIVYCGDDDWDVETSLEEEVNKFLEENKDIHVIDIKYAVYSIGNSSSQSSALVIYEENGRKPFERK